MAREYNAGSSRQSVKSRLNSGVVGMSSVVTGWQIANLRYPVG